MNQDEDNHGEEARVAPVLPLPNQEDEEQVQLQVMSREYLTAQPPTATVARANGFLPAAAHGARVVPQRQM